MFKMKNLFTVILIFTMSIIINPFFLYAKQSKEKLPEMKQINTEEDGISVFILKYGKPDVDQSNLNEIPKPMIPIRWLIYKTEKVHVIFTPDEKQGTHPPYKKWKLFGFMDDNTKKPIDASEAYKRLDKRLKKK